MPYFGKNTSPTEFVPQPGAAVMQLGVLGHASSLRVDQMPCQVVKMSDDVRHFRQP